MNKRRAGAIVSYLYSITQVIVNLIYVPLLLGGIGQSEYGLYQTIGSIIAYLSIINNTFSAGATRFYSKYYVLNDEEAMANTLGILKRIYRIAYMIVFGAAVVLMGVISIVYQSSFSPWEIQESCILLAILALNLVLTMNNTMSIACITAHEEFAFLKISQLITLVLQPILVILFISYVPYAFTVSLVQLFCNFVCRMAQQVYARRKLGMDDKLRYLDKELEHQIIVFSGGVILGVIADQIFWKTNQLILGYMYGTATVAVYSVGSQVVSAYQPLGMAVSSVFMPRVSDLWYGKHDYEAISELFVKVSRIALFPMLAVLLGFVVFGKDFIRLWAGDGYELAYWVTVFELVPFTIDVSQNIGLTILQVMNKYSFRAKMYFVAALLNIILTIAFAQQFGIVGAAAAAGIAMLMSSGIILNWYFQVCAGLNMISWWKNVLREITPMVALCVAAWFAWQPFVGCGWKGLLGGLCCWAAAFTLVSYFLCANSYEKGLIRAAARKLARR